MTELKKTIYLSESQIEAIKKGSNGSFTKRIITLAFIGLEAEEVVREIEEDLIFGEENDWTVKDRIKDLVHKGYLYEKEKEPKIDFTRALGFFNTMYKKKYPTKSLPCA